MSAGLPNTDTPHAAFVRGAWWFMVATTSILWVGRVLVLPDFGEDDLLFLAYLVYAPVGALVALRRPENAVGWVFLWVGLLGAATALALAAANHAVEQGPPYGAAAAAPQAVALALFFPIIILSTSVTFLLYPSGLPSRRWRPLLWLAWFLIGFTFVIVGATPTVTVTQPDSADLELDNPLSPHFLSSFFSAGTDGPENRPLDWTFPAFLLLLVVLSVSAVAAAAYRTWRARGVERLQMRLFAASIAFLLLSLWPAQYLAEHGHSTARFVLISVAFSLIPLSCGVAILRYRLYDIDRIIGRTTSYVLVSGVLLGVYALVVTSVGQLLPESSDLAVAAATLSAAALFRPVLGWARRVVARRFNREQYDAQQAADAFAVRLRDEVDSADVCRDLLGVLDRTVQPATAGIWLRERVQ